MQPQEHGALVRQLTECGFRRPEDAAGAWISLAARVEPSSPFVAHLEEMLGDLKECADPSLAFRTWIRWVEAEMAPEAPSGGSPGPAAPDGSSLQPDEDTPRPPTRAGAWDASREFRKGFVTIAGMSPALGDLLLTYWREFEPSLWRSGWVSRGQLSRRVAARVQDLADKEFLDEVRAIQRVESLRIAYQDCVEELPVDQVTLLISHLADALVSACYDRALLMVSQRQGRRPPTRGLVVLALGKLGGMELNYSSDVDLNFVYDDGLGSLETVDGRRIDDPHEVERFFTLVAERLVQLVTCFTERGQLYRLDARLRPGGASARLVWSARASADYYYSMGRAWERQALIRMRPVAGDFPLAERLRQELDAFVFPSSLSAVEIAEIRGLKQQMERMAEDCGAGEAHIKIGKGGIRDVEYIVQYLQLVHASTAPELKTANTFRVLESLESQGLLQPEETDVLRRGYRFLRRVEHRIQMAYLTQSHRLPDDPADLLRIARGLGFETSEAFRARLVQHSAGIRRVYQLLFEEATSGRDEGHELPALLEIPLEAALSTGPALLAPFGFKDPQRAFLRLRALSEPAEARITLEMQRGKQAFASIVEKLLREVSRQPDPDRTLANFEECVRTLGARSVFYQLLDESSRILQLFIEISSRSSLVVETLRAHPDIFDEIVDALLTGYAFTRDSLIAEVHRLLGQSQDLKHDFFKFKHFHAVLIALRDLERIDNLSHTLLHVAELSEALLTGVLTWSLAQVERKLGSWAGTPPRFLVLGLGKLGGQEMSYKSDLDLIILYSGEAQTNGGIGTQEYFEKLSQVLLHECANSDSAGPLLRVDLRLRPLGNHNSLAISLHAWKHYFSGGSARTWERQAFLRARPIAGDEGLSAEAMRFLREELVLEGSAGPATEAEALADIWEMRRRIETNSRPEDIKRGVGGILDVEFLVQALQLCHGRRHPEVLTANTPAAIQALMCAGLLEPTQASELLTSYQFLRWIENRISLVGESGQTLENTTPAELESLVQKIGYKSTGEETALSIFKGEIDYHRRRNRLQLLRVQRVDMD